MRVEGGGTFSEREKLGGESEREERGGRDWVASPCVMAGPCNRTKLDNAYLEWPKKSRECIGDRHIK